MSNVSFISTNFIIIHKKKVWLTGCYFCMEGQTDKASMLDEIIDYVKFLQLQVKVLYFYLFYPVIVWIVVGRYWVVLSYVYHPFTYSRQIKYNLNTTYEKVTLGLNTTRFFPNYFRLKRSVLLKIVGTIPSFQINIPFHNIYSMKNLKMCNFPLI